MRADRSTPVVVIALAAACIVPDRDIRVIREDTNESPVRLVEPPPQSQLIKCECAGPCEELPPEDIAALSCPVPPSTALPHFLDPIDGTQWQFCSCAEGRVDAKRLPGVFFYVEDQDSEDNAAKVDLYGVLLLDWPAGADPHDYIAYTQALDPLVPLQIKTSTYETEVILRPPPRLREFRVQNLTTGSFDLCNDADKPVTEGYHTLTVLVTDRFWYTYEGVDIQPGVPDLLAGATYDTATYVFHCIEDNPEEDPPDDTPFPNQDYCFCADPQAEE